MSVPLIIHLKIKPDYTTTIVEPATENSNETCSEFKTTIENQLQNRIDQRKYEDTLISIPNASNEPNEEELPMDTFKMKHMYELFKNISHGFFTKHTQSKLLDEWPKCTNIHCYWCTEPFNWSPIGLPFEYIPNSSGSSTIRTEGVYCSFNCAMAHNLEKRDNITSDRSSLLHLVFYQIHRSNSLLHNPSFEDYTITPSLPRETLKKFGGPLTIEEYRALHCYPLISNDNEPIDYFEIKSKVEKNHIEIQQYPPNLISVMPNNEILCTVRKQNEYALKTFHIKEFTDDYEEESELKLKRSKPVLNPKQTLTRFLEKVT